MGGGGVEVAADPAPAGEGVLGVPVSGDSLVALSGFCAALADVICPLGGGLAGEQPYLVGVAVQPGAERVARWLPSCQSRCRLWVIPNEDGLVVACPQVLDGLRVRRFSSWPGVFAGQVGLAEDDDHVFLPRMQAAGAELADRAAAADDVRRELLDAGQIAEHLLVGGVPVGNQDAGEDDKIAVIAAARREPMARSQVSFPPGGRTISTCGAPSSGSPVSGSASRVSTLTGVSSAPSAARPRVRPASRRRTRRPAAWHPAGR